MVGLQKYRQIRFQRVRFTQHTSHIQNRRPKIFPSKSQMCNKTSLLVFVVFSIFDWSLILILTCGQGQLDREDSESAKIFAIRAFFLFFSNFQVFSYKKNWVADAQEWKNLKMQIKIFKKCLSCLEKCAEQNSK